MKQRPFFGDSCHIVVFILYYYWKQSCCAEEVKKDSRSQRQRPEMLFRQRADWWQTADENRLLQIQAGITTSDEDYHARKTEVKRVHAPLQRGLWGWWLWWWFSCNHLPHCVVMATQPEAWALGRRGGNGEQGEGGMHGPSVLLLQPPPLRIN